MSDQAEAETRDIQDTRAALRRRRGERLAAQHDFIALPVLGTVYLVPSKTRGARRAYLTDPVGDGACTCLDWRHGEPCKHIYALRHYYATARVPGPPPGAAPVDQDLAGVLTGVIDAFADNPLNLEDVDVLLNLMRAVADEQKRRASP